MCHLLLSLVSLTSPTSLGKSCLLTALAGLGGNLDPGKLSKEAARRDAGNWSKDRVTAPPRTTPCLLRLLPSLLERPWPSSSCFNFASASLFERFIYYINFKKGYFCHICVDWNLYKESEASEARISEAARSILCFGDIFS